MVVFDKIFLLFTSGGVGGDMGNDRRKRQIELNRKKKEKEKEKTDRKWAEKEAKKAATG